jgi:subtilisin family serine protease
VRVGLLDTSIWPHPMLSGGWVAPSGDVLDGDLSGGTSGQEEPRFVAGHATFIAGLILDQAPGCVVEHRRVLSDETGEADSWEVANAIVRLGDTGVDLMNLSFVCYTHDAQPPLVLATAIDRLDPRIVVVAAAGNHGDLPENEVGHPRQPAWPAALDDVLAVGSIDEHGEEAPFTPANAPWVDVLAPGVDVSSTFFKGRVRLPDDSPGTFDGSASWSGTSFSAALVSGAIAARTVPGEVSARAARDGLADSFERVDGARPRWRPGRADRA